MTTKSERWLKEVISAVKKEAGWNYSKARKEIAEDSVWVEKQYCDEKNPEDVGHALLMRYYDSFGT